MVLVCLPSDALSQHLPSYLGFSYLGRVKSLHGASSKAQLLLLTLDEVYLLMAAPPDLEHGVAPLSPPVPAQQPLLRGEVCHKVSVKNAFFFLAGVPKFWGLMPNDLILIEIKYIATVILLNHPQTIPTL